MHFVIFTSIFQMFCYLRVMPIMYTDQSNVAGHGEVILYSYDAWMSLFSFAGVSVKLAPIVNLLVAIRT